MTSDYKYSFRYTSFGTAISRLVYIALFSLMATASAKGQEAHHLYVSVLQRNNFVVGLKASASGLFSFKSDTSWAHYGWAKNHLNGISYDPSDPNFMFMACGNGVFRTENGGDTWELTTGWKITEVQDVAIDPFRPDTAFIATAYGVWKTFDRGASWDSASTDLNLSYDGPIPNQFFVQAIQIDRQKGEYILAGGEGGLHRSDNAAASWEKVGPVKVAIREIVQSNSDPDLWVAGTEDHGVLISHDAGRRWAYAKGPIAKETIYTLAISPQDSKVMAAAGYQTGVYISNDAGKSWKQYTRGLPVLDFHGLAFDPANKESLWAGSVGKGIFLSKNLGKSWQFKGLDGAEVSDMIFIGGTR